ncbi:MAG TPA: DinB family protein [Thermoanaerobaculia bacterium]|nr:DinB family protein [Thermoanaerobaculia bacterium]
MTKIDEPGEYAQNLLNRLGADDPLTVLERSGAEIRALFEGMVDEAIRRPERPGKWSMLEVAHHLADSDIVSGFRIRMILAHDQPPIVGYDQDLWADKLRYRDARLADVLHQFDAMRDSNLRLARGLDSTQLARYGIHEERGGESVGYMLRLMAGHDLVHRDQLGRVARAVSA